MMKAKIIVTSVLLLFVAVSIIAIGMKQINQSGAESTVVEEEAELYTGIVAYYFHKTKRCDTCQKIEAYSKQVVTENLAPMIEDGTLKWKAVNIDLPENQRFVDDFQLITNALVLVRYENGQQKPHVYLNRIWDLVGDRNEFMAYVQESIVVFAKNS